MATLTQLTKEQLNNFLPESEIAQQITSSHNTLSRLEDRINILQDRLKPIICKNELGPNVAGEDRLNLSPLGEDIRSIDDRIERSYNLIDRMINNLAI